MGWAPSLVGYDNVGLTGRAAASYQRRDFFIRLPRFARLGPDVDGIARRPIETAGTSRA